MESDSESHLLSNRPPPPPLNNAPLSIADFAPDLSARGSLLKRRPTLLSNQSAMSSIRKAPIYSDRFILYTSNGIRRGNSFDALGISDDLFSTVTFWIDVSQPTELELERMAEMFSIHPLTIEDLQMEEPREKSEIFESYFFICVRSFDGDSLSSSYLQPINIYILLFKSFVLTFHSQPLTHPSTVIKRIAHLENFVQITPSWIVYALIDDVVDLFMPIIRAIEMEVDSIDDLVLILKENETQDMLQRIGLARKRVMSLHRLLNSKPDLLKTLIKIFSDRGRKEQIQSEDAVLYLGDVQDHVITMVQALGHSENTLARSYSNYLAQNKIELIQSSNLINEFAARLTILATMLLPMNVITGLWGMNVKVPGQDEDNLAWFFGIVAGMAALAAFLLFVARRRGSI